MGVFSLLLIWSVVGAHVDRASDATVGRAAASSSRRESPSLPRLSVGLTAAGANVVLATHRLPDG